MTDEWKNKFKWRWNADVVKIEWWECDENGLPIKRFKGTNPSIHLDKKLSAFPSFGDWEVATDSDGVVVEAV